MTASKGGGGRTRAPRMSRSSLLMRRVILQLQEYTLGEVADLCCKYKKRKKDAGNFRHT